MKRLPPWNHWPKHVQLLLILITASVIGWVRFHGISLEGDPAAYARLAYLDSQGLPPWTEWTFTQRQGLLAPVSFIVSIFGPQMWAFVIWPWICLVMLSLVIWWIFEGKLQFILLCLLLLGPWPAAYGLQLLPDLPMMAFATVGLALLPHVSATSLKKSWLWGIGFTLAMFISSLCKLTVLYLLPLLAGLIIMDLIHKRNQLFWKSALLSGSLILAAYWGWQMLEGGFVDRLAQIEQDHNSSPFSYSWQDRSGMLRRIFVEPIVSFFGNPGVGILLFPAIAALFSGHQYLKPVLIVFLYFLGIHWLGSTSLSHYSPLPADPRMWILISIPLLVLAGIGLKSASTISNISKREAGLWAAMMFSFAMLAWLVPLPGITIALVAGIVFLPVPAIRKWISVSYIGFLLLWLGYHTINRDNRYYQRQEVEMLHKYVPGSATLYADPILEFSSFQYEAQGIPPISQWPDSLPTSSESGDIFFLWNGFRDEQANLYEDRIAPPFYFDDIRSSWELVEQIDPFDIRLYKHPGQPK